MLTEQDVFREESQDIKEAVDEVKEEVEDATIGYWTSAAIALVLAFVLGLMIGYVAGIQVHEFIPCV